MKFLLSFFVMLLLSTGCTSTAKMGSKPVPEMTFSHVQALLLDVASVDIDNKYDPAADPRDVSSSFPTPPDVALRRYAQKRLSGGSGAGTLNFIIEDAHIHHNYTPPESGLFRLFGSSGVNQYNAVLRLRLYRSWSSGAQSPHSILTLERTLELAESLSLAERASTQLKFLETLIQDVDAAVTQTLKETLSLSLKPQEIVMPSFLEPASIEPAAGD